VRLFFKFQTTNAVIIPNSIGGENIWQLSNAMKDLLIANECQRFRHFFTNNKYLQSWPLETFLLLT
jgi:hypothetical protein